MDTNLSGNNNKQNSNNIKIYGNTTIRNAENSFLLTENELFIPNSHLKNQETNQEKTFSTNNSNNYIENDDQIEIPNRFNLKNYEKTDNGVLFTKKTQ